MQCTLVILGLVGLFLAVHAAPPVAKRHDEGYEGEWHEGEEYVGGHDQGNDYFMREAVSVTDDLAHFFANLDEIRDRRRRFADEQTSAVEIVQSVFGDLKALTVAIEAERTLHQELVSGDGTSGDSASGSRRSVQTPTKRYSMGAILSQLKDIGKKLHV